MSRSGKKLDAKGTRPDPMHDLVANGVDFLMRATDEFKTQPKHSIIAFHSAVELFLKARLMEEHWSLVVSKDPDLKNFQAGDFISVDFGEACRRLAKVVGSGLPEPARQAFDKVRKHRNKLVHFFQDISEPAILEQIAFEQLNAWHGLVGLIKGQWSDVFDRFKIDIDALDRQFAEHRLYLKARFNSIEPMLTARKAAGATITTCGRCGFEASETSVVLCELEVGNCHVCKYGTQWLSLKCTECSATFRAEANETSTCAECDTMFDRGDISDMVDDDPETTDNYYDRITPANCSSCDGYQTVVSFRNHYLCTACLELSDGLSACGWCGEGNNGDMENSGWLGCNFCDGRKGWDRD
jgi:hypothetical protein